MAGYDYFAGGGRAPKMILNQHGEPFRLGAYYRASRQTRETRGLYSVCQRPHEEVTSTDLARLRARCRFVYKNYPQAAGVIDRIVRRVVSGGLRIQSRMRNRQGDYLRDENERLETIINDAWRRNPLKPWSGFAANGQSFKRTMELALRTRLIDGGGLLIASTSSDERRAISREWQLVDVDRLAETQSYEQIQPKMGGDKVVQGIEVTKAGRPVAYHIYKDGGNVWDAPHDTEAIPAERVIHWFKPDRPDQVRGIPFLAKLLLSFADVEEFAKTKIQAEWIANSFAGFRKYENPENLPPPSETITNEAGREEYYEDIHAGTISDLPAGVSMEFANPNRPGGQMEDFMRVYLRAQAVACGQSYEEFAGDYSNASYSAMKAAYAESSFSYKDWSDECDEQIDPIWRDVIDHVFVIHGLMEAPRDAVDLTAHYVQHPRPGYIEPTKEAAAEKIVIDNKLNSRRRLLAERELDFYEVMDELAEEEEYIRERGLDTKMAEKKMAATIQQIPSKGRGIG